MIQCSGDIKKGSGAAYAASPNSHQNSARGANETEHNLNDIEENILDGQNNLRRQLEFISKVSNPIVKDQDPINPNAPVEKLIFEIQK